MKYPGLLILLLMLTNAFAQRQDIAETKVVNILTGDTLLLRTELADKNVLIYYSPETSCHDCMVNLHRFIKAKKRAHTREIILFPYNNNGFAANRTYYYLRSIADSSIELLAELNEPKKPLPKLLGDNSGKFPVLLFLKPMRGRASTLEYYAYELVFDKHGQPLAAIRRKIHHY